MSAAVRGEVTRVLGKRGASLFFMGLANLDAISREIFDVVHEGDQVARLRVAGGARALAEPIGSSVKGGEQQ
jgi:hypothetical protein